MNMVRSKSGRIWVPRGFHEGEAVVVKSQWVDRRYFAMLVNPYRFGAGGGGLATHYLDTDAAGGGDGSLATPWNTLQASVAGLDSLYSSSFVTADVLPTLICTGATDDTTAVTTAWPTSN